MSLVTAASQGDLAGVERLLGEGAAPNEPDENGSLPLHAAARNGHADVIVALLAKGADIKAHAPWGGYVLTFAHPKVIPLLVAQGADLNARAMAGTPLEAAIRTGGQNQEVLARLCSLLAAGADVNAQPDLIFMALYGGGLNGYCGGPLEWLECLLNAGIKLDSKMMMQSVLEAAIEMTTPKHVNALLKAGARIGSVDELCALVNRPFDQFETFARLALESGVDINNKNRVGSTALISAASNYESAHQWLPWLLDQGSDISILDDNGGSALTEALRTNEKKYASTLVKLLLERGAHPDFGKIDGEDALTYCKNKVGYGAIAKLLIKFSSTTKKSVTRGKPSSSELLWNPFLEAVDAYRQAKSLVSILKEYGVALTKVALVAVASQDAFVRHAKSKRKLSKKDLQTPLALHELLWLLCPEKMCSILNAPFGSYTKEELQNFYPDCLRAIAQAGCWQVEHLTHEISSDETESTLSFSAFGDTHTWTFSYGSSYIDVALFDYLHELTNAYLTDTAHWITPGDDVVTTLVALPKALVVRFEELSNRG